MSVIRPSLSVWRYWWQLIRCHPDLYSLTFIFRNLHFLVLGQVYGFIYWAFFKALTGDAPLNWGPLTWAALLVPIALVRNASIAADLFTSFAWTFWSGALMRRNMLEHVLDRPGAQPLPGSTGEAVSRFREDVDEIGTFTDDALFVIAQVLFVIVALIVMLNINLKITLLAEKRPCRIVCSVPY
jgi:ATP-binding cassette, subfamily B, bacterial